MSDKMRTMIGLPNPILIFLAACPVCLFFWLSWIIEGDFFSEGLGAYFIFALFLVILVIVPVACLMYLKLIIVSRDKIIVIHLFRFMYKTYSASELKSVFTQKLTGDYRFYPFDFRQTYLYFGGEKRFNFNSVEMANYSMLKRSLEAIEERNDLANERRSEIK